jgi:hypothetical protein
LQETLAVEVFPVYIKVDLDELLLLRAAIADMLARNDPSPHSELEAVTNPPPRKSIVNAMSGLPTLTTVACEGGVIELLSQKVSLPAVVFVVL